MAVGRPAVDDEGELAITVEEEREHEVTAATNPRPGMEHEEQEHEVRVGVARGVAVIPCAIQDPRSWMPRPSHIAS
jgi:hypothetical protein